jgi:3-phenylpropionate/trans-cinnamate dioxygenase ferredoxin reductase subunit
MAQQTFVIAGGGLAGAKAAQTLREEGFSGRIQLVGSESERPYERPPLSKGYLTGTAQRDSVFVHPTDWYEQHAVELHLGSPAVDLDPVGHQVTLGTGERLGYCGLAWPQRRYDAGCRRVTCTRHCSGPCAR